MYIVQMHRYSASAARKSWSHVLDAAEGGEPVIIERRGVQFAVQVASPRAGYRAARSTSAIAVIDPAVESGEWSWRLGAGGMVFKSRRRGQR
jgi:antitoxin (DNA-binding transcriptional repressor) of toxin-antitoxin stability system